MDKKIILEVVCELVRSIVNSAKYSEDDRFQYIQELIEAEMNGDCQYFINELENIKRTCNTYIEFLKEVQGR